jgi:hypothetical protein
MTAIDIDLIIREINEKPIKDINPDSLNKWRTLLTSLPKEELEPLEKRAKKSSNDRYLGKKYLSTEYLGYSTSTIGR